MSKPHHRYVNAISPICQCRITVMLMPHHLYVHRLPKSPSWTSWTLTAAYTCYVDAVSPLCQRRITFMSMLHHLYVNAASPLCQCRITFMLKPHHCHVYILHQPALTLLTFTILTDNGGVGKGNCWTSGGGVHGKRGRQRRGGAECTYMCAVVYLTFSL